MADIKTRVFMTGATGVMGSEGLKELLKYPEKYDLTILARPSKKNQKKLNKYIQQGINVIWGDLLDKDKLAQGINDSDIVLHVGGLVSPEADKNPRKTLEVNVGSMKHIADIVAEIEKTNPKRIIKVVYIGSVSQYGSFLPPNHWGKVGNTLSAALYDAYALSKIEAERILVESGLRKWVSLRQTAILHPGLLKKANDPISFHVPLKGAIEWVSVEDSGRLLERVCRPEVPDSFWCNYYNVGGGESYRLINYQFERELLKALGCPSPEKIFDTQWFATDNFHGIWFEDSDELDTVLNFRDGKTFEESLHNMKKTLPFYFKLAPLAPSIIIKKFMEKVAHTPELGTLWWIENHRDDKIKAAWGNLENRSKIPGWKNLKIDYPENKMAVKNSNPIRQHLSSELRVVECKQGHKYKTSEILESGGHGCPYCLREKTKIKE